MTSKVQSPKSKERPILFSGEMVKAILAGTKTQTRRIGKCQMDGATELGVAYSLHATRGNTAVATYRAYPTGGSARWGLCECPYGVPGDRIWVKETFALEKRMIFYRADSSTLSADWKGTHPELLAAFENQKPGTLERFTIPRPFSTPPEKWKPSIFMPRLVSRITLEITAIRVERLQNISEADAKAEGILDFTKDGKLKKYWAGDPCDGELKCEWKNLPRSAKEAYQVLWDSINGADSWNKNPWVWVIEFKRVDPKEIMSGDEVTHNAA